MARDRSASYRNASVSIGSSPRAAQSSKPLPSTPVVAPTPPPRSNILSQRWSSSCTNRIHLRVVFKRKLLTATPNSQHLLAALFLLNAKTRIRLQTEHGRENMDAFNLLKTDHRKVEDLFSELESASGQAKMRVFEQIKTELELHTHIEETIFYPALEEPKETHDLTLEAYEEHDVVKKLLKELSRARNADDEWEAKAKVLQENVEHHVEEEENELFKKAGKALSREEIETLGEQMQSEKERKQRTGAKKSGASKSASKTKSASTAQKRTRTSKKSASKSSSKSAAKKR